jgi:hypothetical protein
LFAENNSLKQLFLMKGEEWERGVLEVLGNRYRYRWDRTRYRYCARFALRGGLDRRRSVGVRELMVGRVLGVGPGHWWGLGDLILMRIYGVVEVAEVEVRGGVGRQSYGIEASDRILRE